MKNKNIYIASDHAGFDLKTKLLENFPKFYDLGTNTQESVDYPDFAHKLTKEVLKNKKNIGILICGTGVGMSIVANRKKGINIVVEVRLIEISIIKHSFIIYQCFK